MDITEKQILQLRTNTSVADLERELAHARTKFPSNEHLLAALVEEVGELAKALLESDEGYYDEAIQVACVALRIATEGDPQFPVSCTESPR